MKKDFRHAGLINLRFNGKSFNFDGATTTCTVESSLVERAGNEERVIENFTTTGVAKCNPDDKYDERKGRLISSARAENLAYEKASRTLRDLASYYTDLSAACDQRMYLLNEYTWHNRIFSRNVINDQFKSKKELKAEKEQK